MSTWWDYFWPAVGAGLLIGTLAGLFAFRRTRQLIPIALAAALTLVAAALWHGPLGAGDRFAAKVERNAHQALVYYEMTSVNARLRRDPLTRTLALTGQADDFQRGELVRVLSQLPGVNNVTWSRARGLPLIVEGALAALAGFLLGLALAYLVELRRRHNAQWKW
jgi:hypothetical protein